MLKIIAGSLADSDYDYPLWFDVVAILFFVIPTLFIILVLYGLYRHFTSVKPLDKLPANTKKTVLLIIKVVLIVTLVWGTVFIVYTKVDDFFKGQRQQSFQSCLKQIDAPLGSKERTSATENCQTLLQKDWGL